MSTIEFKNLVIDLDKKVCYIDDTDIKLTKNEFNLLVFLVSNTDKVYSRRELLTNVWGKESSLRTVDTTMSRLRKKLGNLEKHIVTRLGFGYGFFNN